MLIVLICKRAFNTISVAQVIIQGAAIFLCAVVYGKLVQFCHRCSSKSECRRHTWLRTVYYVFRRDLLRYINELLSLIHRVNYFILNILTS